MFQSDNIKEYLEKQADQFRDNSAANEVEIKEKPSLEEEEDDEYESTVRRRRLKKRSEITEAIEEKGK